MIRAVVVDDEPLALLGLLRMLEAQPDLEIVGSARNGPEALDLVRATCPDLVFLDVQMPGLSGLEVAAALSGFGRPDLVFVTAFDAYAVEAFGIDAVDYLLKPVQPGRLRQSLQRARRRLAERGLPHLHPIAKSSLHLSDRNGGVDIQQADILWIEAARDYALIHTDRRSHILRSTMADLVDRLDADIMRVHRSNFVALRRVRRVASIGKGMIALILDENTEVQVGPSYVKAVRTVLRTLI